MKNFKAFSLLGLLFALVLISSSVTADEKPKEENKAVAVEATKETNVPGDVGKKGYGGGGGGGGCGCCYKRGYKYCGTRCCSPENKETKAVSEAAADANPEGYGWGGGRGGGGYGGGGYGGGRGGGWGGGRGGGWGGGRGGGWGGGRCCGGRGKESSSADASEANPAGHGWGGGRGGYGGGGGWGGGN